MGARQERLRAEIEQAREDLARDLRDLRHEAAGRQRRILMIVATLVVAYAGLKVFKAIRRRRD
jgi:hypothetical protein